MPEARDRDVTASQHPTPEKKVRRNRAAGRHLSAIIARARGPRRVRIGDACAGINVNDASAEQRAAQQRAAQQRAAHQRALERRMAAQRKEAARAGQP